MIAAVRSRGSDVLLLGIVLLLALALKSHYSSAGSRELHWILAPTAAVVSAATGLAFEEEPGPGFVNWDRGVIIAPACAGVNFLIIASCVLSFTALPHFVRPRHKLMGLAAAVAAGYGLAVLVNALRIVLSIQAYDARLGGGWLSADRLHRIQGAALYFVALWFAHAAARGLLRQLATDRGKAALCRRLVSAAGPALPLVCYLTGVVVVPAVNQAYRAAPGRFLEHTAFVAAVPLLIAAGFLGLSSIRRRFAKGSS